MIFNFKRGDFNGYVIKMILPETIFLCIALGANTVRGNRTKNLQSEMEDHLLANNKSLPLITYVECVKLPNIEHVPSTPASISPNEYTVTKPYRRFGCVIQFAISERSNSVGENETRSEYNWEDDFFCPHPWFCIRHPATRSILFLYLIIVFAVFTTYIFCILLNCLLKHCDI